MQPERREIRETSRDNEPWRLTIGDPTEHGVDVVADVVEAMHPAGRRGESGDYTVAFMRPTGRNLPEFESLSAVERYRALLELNEYADEFETFRTSRGWIKYNETTPYPVGHLLVRLEPTAPDSPRRGIWGVLEAVEPAELPTREATAVTLSVMYLAPLEAHPDRDDVLTNLTYTW